MTHSTSESVGSIRSARTRRAPGQPSQASTAAEAAFRLMSETAHDIRSPLTTVRESIRLVRDSELGPVNADQELCLSAAIDQCNCLDQMVGEMVQVERLRTGLPRARRRWVSASSVRQAISDTLRPWALPRAINVLWDGADDPNVNIFADPSMIRRLVVNLVSNAIRVIAEGESILIRVQRVRDGEALRWTVADQGPGISATDLNEIANRQVSLGGGEGLGLTICRQLAALHFSSLRIESRVGTGTAVSFETAAGGPSSVAQCWSRWRVGQREPAQKPVSRFAESIEQIRSPRQLRVDNATTIVQLECEGTEPRFEDRTAAGTVMLGAAVPRQAAESFDLMLQSQMRMFDFVYRVDERRWIWVLDANQQDAEQRIDSIDSLARNKIASIRLSWSDPQMIPLDRRRTATRLGDLLVRQSLDSAKVLAGNDGEVRLGKTPIVHSPVAGQRLEDEVRRLVGNLKNQSQRLQSQSREIRPQ